MTAFQKVDFLKNDPKVNFRIRNKPKFILRIKHYN
jgi:hypothetical protein